MAQSLLNFFGGRLAGAAARRERVCLGMGTWGLPPPASAPPALGGVTLATSQVCVGVDYGTQRVGLAAMAGWNPRRLSALPHPGSDLVVARAVARRVATEGATTVVVGLPLDKVGGSACGGTW